MGILKAIIKRSLITFYCMNLVRRMIHLIIINVNDNITVIKEAKMASISRDIMIAHELRDLLEMGVYLPNDKLPSERELCERFNCSRTTLQKSIDTLVCEGLIRSEERSGHFVCEPRFRVRLNQFLSNSQIFNQKGMENKKELIVFETIIANVKIASKLNVLLGTDIWHIKRLRIVNNQPVMIETSYVLKSLCPNLSTKDVIDNSFYDSLANQYGIIVDRSQERIMVESIGQKEGKYLKIDEGTPVIRKEERVFSDVNQLIEYTENIMLMERFEFVK